MVVRHTLTQNKASTEYLDILTSRIGNKQSIFQKPQMSTSELAQSPSPHIDQPPPPTDDDHQNNDNANDNDIEADVCVK